MEDGEGKDVWVWAKEGRERREEREWKREGGREREREEGRKGVPS